MRVLSLLALCSLVACSEPNPLPRITPEPSRIETPPAPSEVPPPPTTTVVVQTLADLTTPVIVRSRGWEHSRTSYDPRIDVRLGAFVEEISQQFTAELRHQTRRARAGLARCQIDAVTRRWATVICATEWEPSDRDDYPTGLIRWYVLAIDDGSVTMASNEGGFVDDGARDAIARDGLDRLCQATHDPAARAHCMNDFHAASQSFLPDGVQFELRDAEGHTMYRVVPYDGILDRLRADGPAARMLQLGRFAPRAPETPAAITTEGPRVMGPTVSVAEALARWALLPPVLRESVVLYRADSGVSGQLGVEAGIPLSLASAAAEALGEVPVRADPTLSPHRLALRRATRSLNMRAEPTSDAAWVDTIPRGGIVAVIEDDDPAANGWRRVAVTRTHAGWVSGRYLEDESCFPSATRVLDAWTSDRYYQRREELSARTMRARTDVFVDGHTRSAALFVANVSLTRVALELLNDDCSLGDEIGSWSLGADVLDVLVSRTTSEGPPLVLVATWPWREGGDRDTATWIALTPDHDDAVWELPGLALPRVANDVVAPATQGPSGRGFWPLAVVRRGAPITPYRWDGTTLVLDTP